MSSLRSRYRTLPYLAVALIASFIGPAYASAQVPVIWESNFGTGLNLFDDDTESAVFGSVVFPYAGNVFTGADILDVSSNGFVSLGGSNGNDCCNGDVTEFLNDPFPRLSPLWADIDPANVPTDNVFVNTFNDDSDASDDRIVVTWDAQHWGSGEDVLFQLQLLESGVIIFGYNGISELDRNTLIGIGLGAGTEDPGADDLSSGPFVTGNNVYELFSPENFALGPRTFDLDNSNVVFTPIPGINQFAVTQVLGVAVPEPSGLTALAFAFCAAVARRRR